MTSSINLESFVRQTLQYLSDQLEAQTDLDVDLNGSQLTICNTKGQTFLLNYHGPTNQLWLSSPLTGAHHFHLKEEKWQSTRSSSSLLEILQNDIYQLFKDRVDF